MNEHVFHPVQSQNMHMGCRSLEVHSSEWSEVHQLGPAGPINLKLVLVGKSNIQDANVFHKYFCQYSSLLALAEIIVCCKTDHSFLLAKAPNQLNHSLLFTSHNTLQHHKIFAEVCEGRLQNKYTERRPAFTPTISTFCSRRPTGSSRALTASPDQETTGTRTGSKNGSKGNREFCRCQYVILSLCRTEFINDFMKVNCYGNQPSEPLYK